jgi:dephospho-CoA kinase
LAQRGWSEDQIEQRIVAQWPSEKKIAAAHFVIWSEGGIEVHQAQVDRILERLKLSRTADQRVIGS